MLTGSPISVTDGGGFNVNYCIFWKIASAESGSYTFTHTVANSCGLVIRYTGANTTTPFLPTPTTNFGTGTTATATGFTTVSNNTLIIFTEQDWGDNTTDTIPPAGTAPTFTERVDAVILYIADGSLATAGATGDYSHTSNSASANPWCAYLIGLNPTGGLAAITGTLNVTQAAQTIASAGTVPVVGTLGVTQANQTIVSAGTVLVGGTLGVTQANQTIVAAGGPVVRGTLAVTAANQTIVAAGGPRVGGTLGVTQAAHTIAALGGPVVRGTLSVAQVNQTLSGAGSVISGVSGSLNVTQAAQILSAAGKIVVSGVLSSGARRADAVCCGGYLAR